MDVTGGDGRDVEPRRQVGQSSVQRAVVPLERPLELHPEVVRAEGGEEPAHGGLVADAVAGAAAEADEALGVGFDVLEGDVGLGRRRAGPALARVRVRVGDEAAEVGPALLGLDQQREMAPVVEVELGAVDGAEVAAEGASGLRELHRPRDGVVVGQREGGVPELQRRGDELIGKRGAVEVREGRVGVELGVGGGHERMFACGAVAYARNPTASRVSPSKPSAWRVTPHQMVLLPNEAPALQPHAQVEIGLELHPTPATLGVHAEAGQDAIIVNVDQVMDRPVQARPRFQPAGEEPEISPAPWQGCASGNLRAG